MDFKLHHFHKLYCCKCASLEWKILLRQKSTHHIWCITSFTEQNDQNVNFGRVTRPLPYVKICLYLKPKVCIWDSFAILLNMPINLAVASNFLLINLTFCLRLQKGVQYVQTGLRIFVTTNCSTCIKKTKIGITDGLSKERKCKMLVGPTSISHKALPM